MEKTITCKFCNKDFKTKLYNKIYCNPVCLSEHRLAMLREKTLNKNKKLLIEGHKKPTAYRNEPWSPNEEKALKILRENGFNSTVISEVFGRTKNSVHFRAYEKKFRYKNKMQASSQKNTFSRNSLKGNNLKPGQLELYAENNIINKLIQNNFEVFKPSIENLEYDLVAYKDEKFFKLQLKSAGYKQKNNSFYVTNTNFFKSINNKVLTDNYKYPNIDYFIINCMGTDYTYILPNKILKKEKNLGLYFYPDRLRHFRPKLTKINTDEYFEKFELIK